MNLLNLVKTATLATALFCVTGVANDANAQFGKKLKDKLEKKIADAAEKQENKPMKEGDPYAEDFKDDSGTSGTYAALDGVPYQNQMGATRIQKTLKFDFVGRDGDKFVNKLKVYINKEGQYLSFQLHEKDTKKLGKRVFDYTTGNEAIWLIEVEDGVFIVAQSDELAPPFVRGTEEISDVFAKDPAKLEVYDLETAAAKFDQMMGAGQEKQDEKIKSQLMEYKAYKNHVGDVVFVDSYGYFQRGVRDKPTEDPKHFLKTRDMGDDLFLAAYFKEKVASSCGDDCQINIVYEMNGKTGDRVKLRNSSAKWNKMISVKKNIDQFCYNFGHQLISSRENIIDYAFMYTLYQNKAQFKEGQTYKMNAKMYSSRDGNNEAEIADGTISFVYKAAKMEKWFKMFREWDEE